jgi:6-phosphogluconolactonase (cycloisomerase 2 family)
MTGDARLLVYIGNWNRHKPPGGTGFGVCRFDPDTGALELVDNVLAGISVGAACLHPSRHILYCVDEYTILPGYYQGGGGQVFAFAIDPASGRLAEISRGPSYGTLPSYVVTDAAGTRLVVVHHTDRVPITRILGEAPGQYRIALDYDDAATVLFPLADDGTIGGPLDVHRHAGDGGPLARQTHPQLHSVTRSPSGRLFVVCDKGNDEIVVFRIGEADRLERCGEAMRTPPGSSPRYSAFHPALPFLFVNFETMGLVSTYRYDETGRLELACTVGVLPEDGEDGLEAKQSDLKLHPDGRHLYSLVRGSSSVAVFAIDPASGALELVQTARLDGLGPRGCAFSPDGRFLLVALLDSHEVSVWAVAPDGRLSPTGHKIRQPNPGTVAVFDPTPPSHHSTAASRT